MHSPRLTPAPLRARRWLVSVVAFGLGAVALVACGGEPQSAPEGERVPHTGEGSSEPVAGGSGALGSDDGDGQDAVPDEAADDGGAEVEAAGGAAEADAPAGEPLAWDSDIDCRIPPMAIARPAACAAGAEYPECKWGMPDTDAAGGLYTRWRNTIDEHTWGRPALVGVLLATSYAFRQRFPNQELLIGDLDAPGPRHVTHKTGVDVDLYLPNTLMVENLGARRYRPNYRTMSNVNIEHARHRVEALARILAVCTEGRLRIYYNDTVVRDRFHAWFDARGYVTPFGRPMQRHNPLHDFHFHVTIAEDTPLPPWLRPYTGEHPVREIDAPPAIEGVTVFAPQAPAGGSGQDATMAPGSGTTMAPAP
ncbi:MAG: penicillin-insensitive murein endopeptidase [Myxococcales bacterium]|nr:penicillin-insensitive murein endopeptidase [Myxococcales bacterium]MCB9629238.1 penicillin-insensitive murein endopeptidase [Sandaracinaceae bacterium]